MVAVYMLREEINEEIIALFLNLKLAAGAPQA